MMANIGPIAAGAVTKLTCGPVCSAIFWPCIWIGDQWSVSAINEMKTMLKKTAADILQKAHEMAKLSICASEISTDFLKLKD